MGALFSVFLSALVFALGLGISGMTDADKVLGFLNVAGDWDPSLAFVMVGAIATHTLLLKLVFAKEKPLFAPSFKLPKARGLDRRLVGGAALFGLGWGLGGFCPGPGLVSSVWIVPEGLVFVGAMILGMAAFHVYDVATQPEATPRERGRSE